jgi:hypothetical protein
VAGNPGVADFNSFRMLRGSIARAAAAVSRQETYFDVALYWFSDRVGALPLEIRDPRRQAESGYSFRSLLDHARRLLISSQVRPFRMGAVAGLGALGASVTGAAAVVALKMFRPGAIDLPGWASLIVVTLFFGGLLCLLIGIALEYLSSLYQQELGKPTFFVVDRSRDALLAELGSLRFDDDPADS